MPWPHFLALADRLARFQAREMLSDLMRAGTTDQMAVRDLLDRAYPFRSRIVTDA